MSESLKYYQAKKKYNEISMLLDTKTPQDFYETGYLEKKLIIFCQTTLLILFIKIYFSRKSKNDFSRYLKYHFYRNYPINSIFYLLL